MANASSCACCFIIPPYLLNQRAGGSGGEASRRAVETIAAMRRIHAMRTASVSSLSVRSPSVALNTAKKRRVFSCENTTDLTAKLVTSEGGPAPTDVAAREAYEWAGVVWDFYSKHFGRNSIDGLGMTVVSSVHYSETGAGFDNALWFKDHMVYGDGGEDFERLTKFLDIAAHEMTHGVIQYSAALPYENESGALNEHFADALGVTVRQWHEGQKNPKTANWRVGDKILSDGSSLRSMAEPGTANSDDPQPGHMRDFVKLPNTYEGDWGGVHYNSGIPNRAYYLAAVGIGRPSWEVVAQIWYRTLTERLKGETSFEKCAYETTSIARDYFDDAVAAKVAQAWIDVGVLKKAIGPLSVLAKSGTASAPASAPKKSSKSGKKPAKPKL